MPRSKNFNSLSLLDQIELLIKKQLPKEAILKQQSLTVTYLLSTNVVPENDPFNIITKSYEVIATYTNDNKINFLVKDGETVLRESNINMNSENDE